MSTATDQHVEQRILALEHALAAAQADVSALSQAVQAGRRTRNVLLSAFAIAATIGLSQPATFAAGAAGQRVVAPFTVVDPQGKPILTVKAAPRSLGLHDVAGNIVVAASALPDAAFIKVLNPALNRVGVLGATKDTALLALRDSDTTNRMSLAVPADGKPSLVLMNDSHINVLTLTQGSSGGGMFQLSNAAGSPMVEGGVTASGVGVVRAGPTFNCGGKAGLVAPDCIVGHQ